MEEKERGAHKEGKSIKREKGGSAMHLEPSSEDIASFVAVLAKRRELKYAKKEFKKCVRSSTVRE